MSSPPSELSSFRRVPRTGVIYVSNEAGKRGFKMGAEGWCNLGQGQPETGSLPGAPKRITSIPVAEEDYEYAPVPGLWELREAVAAMYNRLYRRGMSSQYTAENVAIQGGGRVAIMRACAAIGPVHLGHFLPDYTAYEELLDVFRRFQPIPILLDPERGYRFEADELEREISGRGLGAIMMSNACNPTGRLVDGALLSDWVGIARRMSCALLMDEFYSHYVWNDEGKPVSAAAYVENVERDPVVLVDGLTKNWRYPGLRLSWVVGPSHVVDSIASAGSFLDGGGVAPVQRAAIPLLTEEHVRAESTAIRAAFMPKRQLLLDRLRGMGVHFDLEPEGTFYAWGDLKALPPSLRNAHDFFAAALDRKVICVPGNFFDVNPGGRRAQRPSRFRHHIRFSFGPSIDVLEDAMDRLAAMVAEAD